MNIDERARRAATDILERASARNVPTREDLAVPASRRRLYPLLGAAAALVLVGVGVAILATRPDETVRTITSLPAPRSVEARAWSPVGLGITMTVPATWEEGPPVAGFRFSIGEATRDGYVLADRLRNVEALDTESVGSSRAADLQSLGATDLRTATVEIGGRRAVELRYRLHVGDADRMVAVTEYDIADGEWVFLVAISELEPVDRVETTEWVASTLRVRALDADEVAFADPIEHPAVPLPAPTGINAKQWAPDGLGATLQVPETWEEMVASPAGFDHAIEPPGGGPTVMASIRSDNAAGREARLASIGAVIESAMDTSVAGRPARAIRYWIAAPGYPLRVFLDVEYVIDVGNGDTLIVTTSEYDGGDDNSALLRWIRSTVTIDDEAPD